MSKKKKFDPFEEERVDSVEAVKAELSPATPCVHADAEGYCTGACEGSICCHCADYKPVTAVATQTAATDIMLEPTQGATAADCVQHDLQMSRKHAAYSAAYLARAGWQLAQEKVRIGHGGWEKWCKENLGFSKDTADRYIAFYHATVGKWREAQGLANTMVAELTDKMIAAATRELEYKTGTQAMIELGVIKRPAKWGGEREGAGRKAAAAAAVSGDGLDMGDSATLMWLDAMRPFEQNRAAFHSAARDLNPNVAARFLEEIRMLERTLSERVKGGR